MMFVSLEDAKAYERIDYDDEDSLIGSLLSSAGCLCKDIARLSDAQWADIDSDKPWSDLYSKTEMENIRSTLRVAVLYAFGYLFEHRDNADHHSLTLTLRSLLFSIREGIL